MTFEEKLEDILWNEIDFHSCESCSGIEGISEAKEAILKLFNDEVLEHDPDCRMNFDINPRCDCHYESQRQKLFGKGGE